MGKVQGPLGFTRPKPRMDNPWSWIIVGFIVCLYRRFNNKHEAPSGVGQGGNLSYAGTAALLRKDLHWLGWEIRSLVDRWSTEVDMAGSWVVFACGGS